MVGGQIYLFFASVSDFRDLRFICLGDKNLLVSGGETRYNIGGENK